ncbi:MAG: RcnB family protein [Pseudomonadota bacterium]
MRKFMIPLLIASALASPAVAAGRGGFGGGSGGGGMRVERMSGGFGGGMRVERMSGGFGGGSFGGGMRTERMSSGFGGGMRAERPAGFGGFARSADARPVVRPVPNAFGGGGPRGELRPQAVQPMRDWRGPAAQPFARPVIDQRFERGADRARWQTARPGPNGAAMRPPVVSNVPQPGTQPPPMASRPTSQPQWSTAWRQNSQYDWDGWRNQHRSLFQLGAYYDPFGWGYRPYQIGWRMWPSYYGSSFWLNDPWQYRLPYAPAGTQWVRYYNDALLVDMYSGQVVDVIYSFFW